MENVRGIVQRAEKGGVLSMAELLTVADTLRNFRELVKWYGLTEHDVRGRRFVLCHDAPADAGKDDKGFDFVRK